jgi:magnesium chelatase family protein
VRARVEAARQRQLARAGVANHQLGAKQIDTLCALDGEGRALLEQAGTRLGFSARAYHRIMKVARTIADLDGQERIAPAHVGEAIQYRCLDRRNAF